MGDFVNFCEFIKPDVDTIEILEKKRSKIVNISLLNRLICGVTCLILSL